MHMVKLVEAQDRCRGGGGHVQIGGRGGECTQRPAEVRVCSKGVVVNGDVFWGELQALMDQWVSFRIW